MPESVIIEDAPLPDIALYIQQVGCCVGLAQMRRCPTLRCTSSRLVVVWG